MMEKTVLRRLFVVILLTLCCAIGATAIPTTPKPTVIQTTVHTIHQEPASADKPKNKITDLIKLFSGYIDSANSTVKPPTTKTPATRISSPTTTTTPKSSPWGTRTTGKPLSNTSPANNLAQLSYANAAGSISRPQNNSQNVNIGTGFPPLPGGANPKPNYAGAVAGNGGGGSKPNYAGVAGQGGTGGTLPTTGGGNSGPSEPPTSKPPINNIASDEELAELSEALLRKDVNNAGKYVTLNVQSKSAYGALTDAAPLPLLTVHPDAYTIPTISKLRLLFDNYVADVLVNEYVTPIERSEEDDLLNTMITTPVMVHARKFLMDKGVIGKDPKDFWDTLRRIWFTMYSRGGGKIGSSGFEHVFLSELKKGDIMGLHNWVYYNDEEKMHHADYWGYTREINLGGKGSILKYRFKYNNLDKPVNTMFVGTSPELEMALYSVCFLVRPDRRCPLKMNGKKVGIKTYVTKYRGKEMIGSAFPEI